MFIGPGGIGKSSFLCGLMNKPLPVGDSTRLAQSSTVKLSSQRWVSTGEDPDAFWIEVRDEDEVAELAGMVHLVVKDDTRKRHDSKDTVEQISTTLGSDDHVKIQMKVINEVLIRARSMSKSKKIPKFEVLLYTWDCGGQAVFLEVLPAFLTRKTMFLLMYDARRKLMDACESRTHQQGKVLSKHLHKISTQDMLLEWMACIHTMLCSHQSGQDIPKFPRIITAGTHGDDPEVKANKDRIIAGLNSACKGKAFLHLLTDNVIVDNTTAGQGDNEDPVYKQVRREISLFTKNELTVPTPIAWVLYRRVLQKTAKETDSNTISYEVAKKIGQACNIPEDDIPSVLQFYHDLAVFLHYSRVPSLKEHIIVNPQWLINQFAKILTPKGLEGFQNPALWDSLQKQGILEQSLYEQIWYDSGSEISPQPLVDLLVHFLLASPIGEGFTVSYIPGKKYFVSCVLPACPEDQLDTMKGVILHAAPLHLCFNTQYVPPGFFTRLITSLANEQKCDVIFTDGVYCDRITMFYGDPSYKIDEVTISRLSSSIQLKVARTKCRPLQCSPFSIACLSVFSLVNKCIGDVLEWFPGIEVSYAFICEHCPKEQNLDQKHFIPIPTNSTTQAVLRCEKLQYPQLTQHHQFWLTVSEDEQLLVGFLLILLAICLSIIEQLNFNIL